MNLTKHDVCSETVMLDFDALKKTAEIAYYAKLNDVSEIVHNLQCNMGKNREVSIYLDANNLRQSAESLTIAAETMHVLNEAVMRNEIILMRNGYVAAKISEKEKI